MDDYPTNSRRVRAPHVSEPAVEKPALEKVVTNEVIRRKKPLGKRFTETFTSGDARGVFSYVVMDVMLPAAKDMIADAMSEGVSRVLFGDSARSRRAAASGRNTGYTPYNRPGTPSRDDPRSISRHARAVHNFDEIILETKVEAEDILTRMLDLLQKYEQVKVSDLYDLAGITGSYTDEKYGWHDLRGADVTRIRGGNYLLDLPPTVLLD